MNITGFKDFFLESCKAILFDFDGVIAASEDCHFKAFTDTLLDKLDISVNEEEYKIYRGGSLEDNLRLALERHNKKESNFPISDLIIEKFNRFRELVPGIKTLPGVRDFFLLAGKRNLPIAVVSSSLRIEIQTVLDRLNLSKLIVGIVAADDLRSGERKPSPIPYERGLELINSAKKSPTLPNECLVIEDSAGGVKSGSAAGMKVLAVSDPANEKKLKEAGALWLAPSLMDVLKVLEKS